jgi:xylose isomerase
MKGNKHKAFSDNTVLSQIKLKNILALYEKIEEKYFPFVTTNIRPEYMNLKNEAEIRESLQKILGQCDLVQNGGTALNEGELIPSRRQF